MGLEISPFFAGIPAVAVLGVVLHISLGVFVVNARKKYGVEYPAMYAVESENKNAKAFNCVQRGHQNCLEMLPYFFVSLVLGGIQHPVAGTILGALYLVARALFFFGYASGHPNGRFVGIWHFFCLFGLMGLTVSFAVHIAKGDYSK